MHKTDAGKTDYTNERKKFRSHTASLEKRFDHSQRISLTNEQKMTMKDCGIRRAEPGTMSKALR